MSDNCSIPAYVSLHIASDHLAELVGRQELRETLLETTHESSHSNFLVLEEKLFRHVEHFFFVDP
jgi:hypothetical protein